MEEAVLGKALEYLNGLVISGMIMHSIETKEATRTFTRMCSILSYNEVCDLRSILLTISEKFSEHVNSTKGGR